MEVTHTHTPKKKKKKRTLKSNVGTLPVLELVVTEYAVMEKLSLLQRT
jgi:hypothetical protein